jgi:hypothetical protein
MHHPFDACGSVFGFRISKVIPEERSRILPTRGLFQLRARDVMGYTFVVFLVLVPVVLLLVTILGATPR